jgi:hypothetical protein
MNVVPFPRAAEMDGWQTSELAKLTNVCAAAMPSGEISGWEVGQTEYGDPQLYLLGPAPNYDCVLCVSRLGRLYVLEDGTGQVVFENDNIVQMAEQAYTTLRKRKAELVARLAVCWCAVREFFEEKVEPVLAEPIEFVTHFAPQLAALA